jgi:hypothetical protein
VEACWRCEKPCSRLTTIPSFNRPARAAVECYVLRGLFRGQTASRSFGRTAAENVEFGSQRPLTTAPLGVGRVVRRARWVKHREWFYLVEALYPASAAPSAFIPLRRLGLFFASFCSVQCPHDLSPIVPFGEKLPSDAMVRISMYRKPYCFSSYPRTRLLAIGKVKNCGSHHIVSVQIETCSL